MSKRLGYKRADRCRKDQGMDCHDVGAHLRYGLTAWIERPDTGDECAGLIERTLRQWLVDASGGVSTGDLVELVTIGRVSVGVWCHQEVAPTILLALGHANLSRMYIEMQPLFFEFQTAMCLLVVYPFTYTPEEAN
jgi:hypothetical protein